MTHEDEFHWRSGCALEPSSELGATGQGEERNDSTHGRREEQEEEEAHGRLATLPGRDCVTVISSAATQTHSGHIPLDFLV